MFTKRVWNETNWFLAGLIVGALAASELPAGGIDATSHQVQLAELPAPRAGIGHGNNCRVPDHGMYFWNRDFKNEIGTYRGFAMWCRMHGGQIGWAE